MNLEKYLNKKSMFGMACLIQNGDGSYSEKSAVGDMQEDDSFFIASVTKLFITSIVFQSTKEGKFQLDDPISQYLPGEIMKSLHVLGGKDYSGEIKILHLISNTSGIPDYFFHKNEEGVASADILLAGKDEAWDLARILPMVKTMRPNFPPGKPGKVSYSDTNYQLLGRILENVWNKPIELILKEKIFIPLGLKSTYCFKDTDDTNPKPFYYGSRKLWLPVYIASVTAEGGIVSTLDDLMVFLKSFFQGKIIPLETIESLKKWNLLFPPPGFFYFGIGLEKLFIPWIVSPFKPIREVIGFWGQTGSFAFHHPQTDLYFCGTTNQINGDGHKAVVKLIIREIKKF